MRLIHAIETPCYLRKKDNQLFQIIEMTPSYTEKGRVTSFTLYSQETHETIKVFPSLLESTLSTHRISEPIFKEEYRPVKETDPSIKILSKREEALIKHTMDFFIKTLNEQLNDPSFNLVFNEQIQKFISVKQELEHLRLKF